MSRRDPAVTSWLTGSFWPPVEGSDPLARSVEQLTEAKSHLRDIESIPPIEPTVPTASYGTRRHRKQDKVYLIALEAEAARASATSGAKHSVTSAQKNVRDIVTAMFEENSHIRHLHDLEIDAREKAEANLWWLQAQHETSPSPESSNEGGAA